MKKDPLLKKVQTTDFVRDKKKKKDKVKGGGVKDLFVKKNWVPKRLVWLKNARMGTRQGKKRGGGHSMGGENWGRFGGH